MENFTKNSLKAAVGKYGSLHSDGKTEAELKAELAKDERGFSAEQIDEIYAAIIGPPELFGGDNPKEQENSQPVLQQHGAEQEATLLSEKEPDWVGKLLSLVGDLKDEVGELKKSLAKSSKEATPNAVAEPIQLIDEDETYEVAPGKSFRDPVDFTKEYTEGDDVTHLGVIKLQALLNSGLIQEAE